MRHGGMTVLETVQAVRLPPASRLVWLRGGGHSLDAGEGYVGGFLPAVRTRLRGIDVLVIERRGSPGSVQSENASVPDGRDQ